MIKSGVSFKHARTRAQLFGFVGLRTVGEIESHGS